MLQTKNFEKPLVPPQTPLDLFLFAKVCAWLLHLPLAGSHRVLRGRESLTCPIRQAGEAHPDTDTRPQSGLRYP